MSWSDRRRALLLLAGLPALAACGYAPAYGTGGAAGRLRGQIRAADPKDELDFAFVARIEERLGRPQGARYMLDYRISTDSRGVGITPETEVTRYDLTGSIDWTLKEAASGARISGGEVSSFTAWFTTGTTVATQAAEVDANRRLMRILADQIVARLVALADDLP